MDKTSCPHLRDMLRMSSKLENLNVACNQLGQDGGKILLEGVKMSRAIKRVRWSRIHNYISRFFSIVPLHLTINAKWIIKHYFRLMFDWQDVEETLICQSKKYYEKTSQWASDIKERHNSLINLWVTLSTWTHDAIHDDWH